MGNTCKWIGRSQCDTDNNPEKYFLKISRTIKTTTEQAVPVSV